MSLDRYMSFSCCWFFPFIESYKYFYKSNLWITWSIEFFLNDFLWIQRIQWIMTKSKGSMVTRDMLCLTIDTFPDIVVNLFRVLSGNRYLPRGSNENTLCITSTGNVSVARWVIALVTVLLLDLVMIHWIRWIQGKSFRQNSNNIKRMDSNQ